MTVNVARVDLGSEEWEAMKHLRNSFYNETLLAEMEAYGLTIEQIEEKLSIIFQHPQMAWGAKVIEATRAQYV